MNNKIIISGGGTGGHVFPAIAIANAIKQIEPNAEILFIGAKGRMEMTKVAEAGYDIKGLWISGLQRKLTFKNLLFPIKVIYSIIAARRIIKKFNPNVVVGVGGYASAPAIKAASQLKIPILLQEQNSFPGLTNKILGKKATKVCVAYLNMEKYFQKDKIIVTGNPVRNEIINSKHLKYEAMNFFNLDPEKLTILVVGGSLGALTINESIHADLKKFYDNKLQLIWQTGSNYAENAKNAVMPFEKDGIVTSPFINNMALAYSAADIVISRAGAIAISELCVAEKATILVPSPNVVDDHQTKNAQALVDNNAAIMVKDINAREQLVDTCVNLAINIDFRRSLSYNIAKLSMPDAAINIAKEVLTIIDETNG